MIYTSETGLPTIFSEGIHSIVYNSKTNFGNYKDIIPLYKNTLFIFNDNDEDHKTSIDDDVRFFNLYNTSFSISDVKSAGISIQFSKRSCGFQKLTENVQKILDNELLEIQTLLDLRPFRSMIYSSDVTGKLDTGLVKVSQDVLDYILKRLCELSMTHLNKNNFSSTKSKDSLQCNV